MKYYYTKKLDVTFEEAIQIVTKELENEAFSVVTKLDVKEKFKDALGIDYKNYQILGACNPGFAHKALEIEDKIGTMLPCNFIIQDEEGGGVSVSAINPMATMFEINNPELDKIAFQITEKINKVIEKL